MVWVCAARETWHDSAMRLCPPKVHNSAAISPWLAGVVVAEGSLVIHPAGNVCIILLCYHRRAFILPPLYHIIVLFHIIVCFLLLLPSSSYLFFRHPTPPSPRLFLSFFFFVLRVSSLYSLFLGLSTCVMWMCEHVFVMWMCQRVMYMWVRVSASVCNIPAYNVCVMCVGAYVCIMWVSPCTHVSVKCNMCICVYTYQRLHVISLSAYLCNVRVSAHVIWVRACTWNECVSMYIQYMSACHVMCVSPSNAMCVCVKHHSLGTEGLWLHY